MRTVCPECGHALEMNEKFRGRKLLCSGCNVKYVIPGAADAQAPKPSRAPAPRPAAAAGGLDPRRYLKIAAEKGYVTGGMLDKCLSAWDRRQAEGEAGVGFGEFLVERGFVSAEENRSVLLLLNRSLAGEHRGLGVAAATAPAAGMRECPNCFENIVERSRSCRYCGVSLAEPEVSEQCPNCLGSQPPGSRFCRACGANMQTGLIGDGARRRCPRCAVLSTGMETVCVVCKTPFDRPTSTVVAQEAAKSFARVLRDNQGFLIMAVVILGAVWMFRHRGEISTGVSEQLYGQEEAALRRRVDEFAVALRYGNLDGAGKLAFQDGRVLTGVEVRNAWTALTGAPGSDDTLDVAKVTQVEVAGSQATVYADITVRFAKVEKPKLDPELPAIAQLGLGGPTTKQTRCTWRWAKMDGQWYCVGPFR